MSHSHTHDGHGHHGSYLERKGGWITTIFDWATTVDHKKIGVMYLFTILFMFFLGGAAALAVRMELLVPTTIDAAGQIQGQMFKPADATAISAGNNIYNRLFTLHGAIMVFMVIVPSIPASLGNFLLPLIT